MRFIVAATFAGLSMAAPIAQEPAAVQSLQLQAPPAPAPPAAYAPPAQAPGMPSAAAIAFANDPARGAMAGIYDFWAGQAKNFQNWQAAAAADWAKNGAVSIHDAQANFVVILTDLTPSRPTPLPTTRARLTGGRAPSVA